MTTSPSAKPALCIASLIVFGLVAFWPSVWFDFVNWDDPSYVQHNELIRGWSFGNLAGIATETVTRNYAPITIFSFLVDHTLWGMNPGGYHATNVLLHLLNGILVFLLITRLSGNRFVGWFTAALFLVHPVQIESVAWISSRKGLLCAAFMLGACLVRLRPEVESRQDGWYIGLLVAALLSKALAVVLPPIVFLYDVCVRRMGFADAAVRQVIPAFFSVLLLLHTMGAQNSVLGGIRSHMELPLWQIAAVDVTILWQYIGMLIWPADLCVLYDPPVTGILRQVLAGTAGWLVVAAVLVFFSRTKPLLLVGAGSFLLLLFPVLNFFRITTLMNDRYLYLPCIPVFALAGWLLSRAFAVATDRLAVVPPRMVQTGRALAGVAIVAASLAATVQHLPVWRNSFSLWEHAGQQQPLIPVVRIQMALTLHDNGRLQDAVRVLSLALLETSPDTADRQRMQRAIQQWREELSARRTASVVLPTSG